jgi:hypothetical protein
MDERAIISMVTFAQISDLRNGLARFHKHYDICANSDLRNEQARFHKPGVISEKLQT